MPKGTFPGAIGLGGIALGETGLCATCAGTTGLGATSFALACIGKTGLGATSFVVTCVDKTVLAGTSLDATFDASLLGGILLLSGKAFGALGRGT